MDLWCDRLFFPDKFVCHFKENLSKLLVSCFSVFQVLLSGKQEKSRMGRQGTRKTKNLAPVLVAVPFFKPYHLSGPRCALFFVKS